MWERIYFYFPLFFSLSQFFQQQFLFWLETIKLRSSPGPRSHSLSSAVLQKWMAKQNRAREREKKRAESPYRRESSLLRSAEFLTHLPHVWRLALFSGEKNRINYSSQKPRVEET
jgi:hypothetical protein